MLRLASDASTRALINPPLPAPHAPHEATPLASSHTTAQSAFRSGHDPEWNRLRAGSANWPVPSHLVDRWNEMARMWMRRVGELLPGASIFFMRSKTQGHMGNPTRSEASFVELSTHLSYAPHRSGGAVGPATARQAGRQTDAVDQDTRTHSPRIRRGPTTQPLGDVRSRDRIRSNSSQQGAVVTRLPTFHRPGPPWWPLAPHASPSSPVPIAVPPSSSARSSLALPDRPRPRPRAAAIHTKEKRRRRPITGLGFP